MPVYATVTKTLSALNRKQLQKLFQYAIDEDPAGILGKAFKRIDQVRDAKSKINVTPGLPDKTLSSGREVASIWELTLNKLSRHFNSAYRNLMSTFPVGFDESKQKHYLYKRFMGRVIDLVQTDQIEAAGQVLITLITVAANFDLRIPFESTINKRYTFLLKTIERMCSFYILQYTGQARKNLIILCQNLNKTLRVVPSHSSWAELPPLSLLFPFQSASEPGIMGAKQDIHVL